MPNNAMAAAMPWEPVDEPEDAPEADGTARRAGADEATVQRPSVEPTAADAPPQARCDVNPRVGIAAMRPAKHAAMSGRAQALRAPADRAADAKRLWAAPIVAQMQTLVRLPTQATRTACTALSSE